MDMIRRLHRKFIWMATASVVAIIVLAVGLINGSLYVRVHHEISSITDIISQNGGTIPSDLAPAGERTLRIRELGGRNT